MTPQEWRPLGRALNEHTMARPEVGRLVASNHAVWRVTAVRDLPVVEMQRLARVDPWAPTVEVDLEWVGGALPDWAEPGGPVRAVMQARRGEFWMYPPSGRWPMCSCCGEPMPCRAELEDAEVSEGLRQVARHDAKVPGACWACMEPVSSRQKSVTYPGDNLDLPGREGPTFHLRQDCHRSAHLYEERWVAVDPRRERIITYPMCGGILAVHADGSSECVSGTTPVGGDAVSERECRGHLTHDHRTMSACYAVGRWFDPAAEREPCNRGCSVHSRHGTRTTPRPERRTTGADR